MRGIAEVRKNIPQGKTRVVGADLFSHDDWIVDDYDSRDEAFKIADEHNKTRTDSMDDVYYVYDDTGKYLRGNEAVNGLGVSP